ncbi:MAG: hypothetical protein AAF533_23000 [Acidobacteriota bacterium]
MTRVLSLLVLLLLAPDTWAQDQEGRRERRRGLSRESREELRSVLKDYFLQSLERELALTPDEKQRLAPVLQEYFDAQAQTNATRRQSLRSLEQALRADDPAQLRKSLDQARTTQSDLLRADHERRRSVLKQLPGRKQAQFLLVQDDVRRRVMQRARDLRRAGDGKPERPQRPIGGRRHSAPDAEELAERRENASFEIAMLLRQEMKLPTERVLRLLPTVERLAEASVGLRELHERAGAELQQALEAGDDDTTLAEIVQGHLLTEGKRLDAIFKARDDLLRRFEPADQARLLLELDAALKGGKSRARDRFRDGGRERRQERRRFGREGRGRRSR